VRYWTESSELRRQSREIQGNESSEIQGSGSNEINKSKSSDVREIIQ
jgi:hypothetical protein